MRSYEFEQDFFFFWDFFGFFLGKGGLSLSVPFKENCRSMFSSNKLRVLFFFSFLSFLGRKEKKEKKSKGKGKKGGKEGSFYLFNLFERQ